MRGENIQSGRRLIYLMCGIVMGMRGVGRLPNLDRSLQV